MLPRELFAFLINGGNVNKSWVIISRILDYKPVTSKLAVMLNLLKGLSISVWGGGIFSKPLIPKGWGSPLDFWGLSPT